MEAVEYRKMAEVEDAMWYYRALHRHVRASLATVTAPAARAGGVVNILDAGCGTGGLLRRLHEARPEWQLTGLDYFSDACELARERTGLAIVQGSVTALPFPDATFDAISSCDVVCQVEDAAAAAREFFRCLKPGGALVMTMPAYQWMYSYHDREVGNLRRYTRAGVRRLVASAGFAVERDTYWNTLPFPLAVVRRKVFPPAKSESDVGLFPAPVEVAFNGLMKVEHSWVEAGGRLPFGSSVLTVARKLA